MSWKVLYTKQAQKDAHKIADSGLKLKAKKLIEILRSDPLKEPPPYEKLVGDLSGAHSRRIGDRKIGDSPQ